MYSHVLSIICWYPKRTNIPEPLQSTEKAYRKNFLQSENCLNPREIIVILATKATFASLNNHLAVG